MSRRGAGGLAARLIDAHGGVTSVYTQDVVSDCRSLERERETQRHTSYRAAPGPGKLLY